jgi:hypothetical protein
VYMGAVMLWIGGAAEIAIFGFERPVE